MAIAPMVSCAAINSGGCRGHSLPGPRKTRPRRPYWVSGCTILGHFEGGAFCRAFSAYQEGIPLVETCGFGS